MQSLTCPRTRERLPIHACTHAHNYIIHITHIIHIIWTLYKQEPKSRFSLSNVESNCYGHHASSLATSQSPHDASRPWPSGQGRGTPWPCWSYGGGRSWVQPPWPSGQGCGTPWPCWSYGAREVVISASMAEWSRAWDTFAMLKLWRREVVSSASMAEWSGVWDTLAMLKLWSAGGCEFSLHGRVVKGVGHLCHAEAMERGRLWVQPHLGHDEVMERGRSRVQPLWPSGQGCGTPWPCWSYGGGRSWVRSPTGATGTVFSSEHAFLS